MTTLNQRAAAALATLEQQGRIKSRWLPGMRVWVNTPDGFRLVPFRVRPDSTPKPDWYPDLSDPLTVQALLLLVREAAGVPDLHTFRARNIKGEWYWGVGDLASCDRKHLGTGPTEAEALVHALEALAAETA